MTILQAIILGVVQGFTEFLPVSSSGHLVILQNWLGVQGPDLVFDVMVHFGTLVAVVVALREDIAGILKGLFAAGQRANPAGRKLAVFVVLGTIPVGLVGLLLKDAVEQAFGQPAFAAGMLFVTGAVLWISESMAKRRPSGLRLDQMRAFDALFVGIGQAFAILPGLSRSGTTIGAGLVRGIDREAAARFSFLLSIPAILGAAVVQVPSVFDANFTAAVPVLAVGMLAAMVSGYLAIDLLLRFIRRGNLRWFSAYTWLVGIIVLILI